MVDKSCKCKLVSEIMKITDEREMPKQNKTQKNKDRQWQGGTEAIVKGES